MTDVWQAAGKAARKLVLPNGRGRDLENTQPREKSYVTPRAPSYRPLHKDSAKNTKLVLTFLTRGIGQALPAPIAEAGAAEAVVEPTWSWPSWLGSQAPPSL